MSRESMAWLGVAFWLIEHGYTPGQAVIYAGPFLEMFGQAFREAL